MNSVRCKLTEDGLHDLVARKERLLTKLKLLENNMDDISLSEAIDDNLEYQEMRRERLALLEEIEQVATIIDHADIIHRKSFSRIQPGCEVKLGNHVICYLLHIVSSYEANPRVGKISCSSPLGQSLLGKKVGDEVLAQTPLGKVNFEIVSVQ